MNQPFLANLAILTLLSWSRLAWACSEAAALDAQQMMAGLRTQSASEALATLEAANSRCPDNPVILLQLGSRLMQNDKHAEAGLRLKNALAYLDTDREANIPLYLAVQTRRVENFLLDAKRGDALAAMSEMKLMAREKGIDLRTHSHVLEVMKRLDRELDLRPLTSKEIKHAFKTRSIKLEAAPLEVSYRIQFDFNSDRLNADASGKIAAIASGLVDSMRIEIIGHTDDVGDEDYNLKLSERRAERVLNALATEQPALSGRMHALGQGESQPVYANDNPENRALNRRVELRLNQGN